MEKQKRLTSSMRQELRDRLKLITDENAELELKLDDRRQFMDSLRKGVSRLCTFLIAHVSG